MGHLRSGVGATVGSQTMGPFKGYDAYIQWVTAL